MVSPKWWQLKLVKYIQAHPHFHSANRQATSPPPYHNTTALRTFFRDHPGKLVPEENFWTLWCKGRLTEADTPTIRLGATPSGLTSAHLHHPLIFLQAGCPSCRPTDSVKVLKATSTFRLGRRRWSSPQRCYLHQLRTMSNITHAQIYMSFSLTSKSFRTIH